MKIVFNNFIEKIEMDRVFEKVIINDAEARNVQGSSCDRISKSWISKWEEITHRKAGTCSFFGCAEDATHGGHLWIKHQRKDYYYIAPICNSCNSSHNDDDYKKMKKNVAYMKVTVNQCIYDDSEEDY